MQNKKIILTEDETFTSASLAEIIHASEETVRWMRHVGRGPRWFRTPGSRRVLYLRSDVEAWLASGYAETPQPADARA